MTGTAAFLNVEAWIQKRVTKWSTAEFGIVLTIVPLAIGTYFWRRRGELPSAVRL